MDARNPTSIKTVALTGAAQVLFAGNPRRRAIILFIPSGITLTLNYSSPASQTDGLRLSNQTYPYIFDSERFGDMPTRTIQGLSSAADTLGYLEVFDERTGHSEGFELPLSIPPPPDFGAR